MEKFFLLGKKITKKSCLCREGIKLKEEIRSLQLSTTGRPVSDTINP